MSAYIVDRAHIDALIRTAKDGPTDGADRWAFKWVHSGSLYELTDAGDADRLGRVLWSENVASLRARYPDDGPNNRPGPAGFHDDDAESYTYGPSPSLVRDDGPEPGRQYSVTALAGSGSWARALVPEPVGQRLSIAQTAAALDGYAYQSCEHPGWRASEACAFVTAFRAALLGVLPGYADAGTWSIHTPA